MPALVAIGHESNYVFPMWVKRVFVMAAVLLAGVIAWSLLHRQPRPSRVEPLATQGPDNDEEKGTQPSAAASAASPEESAIAIPPTTPAISGNTSASSSESPPASTGAAIPPEILAIRAIVASNPRAAEELVYSDRKRSPDSPFADERDALLVSALNNERRPAEAQAAARRYFRSHPDGRYAEYVSRATGVHPQ